MPIKGLSETRRLPRLGKIHLGVKKTKVINGREVEYPSAVDYFVFPEDNAHYDELVRVFGDKPKELRVLIPVEEEDRFASQYYRCYYRDKWLRRKRPMICRMLLLLNNECDSGLVKTRNMKVPSHIGCVVVTTETN